MMRIGFDCTPLCSSRSGVAVYTGNLLEQLRLGTDEVIPLTNCAEQTMPGSLAHRVRLNKTVWMQALLPFQLLRQRLDVAHFTNSVAPLLSPCPTVVTIHDMTLWLYPQHHYQKRLLAMRPFIPLAARRAERLIAPSQATKRDIVRILGIPAEKVEVIYEAPSACFMQPVTVERLEAVRTQYGLPERFILYVGTLEPRKNLVRVLEAFAQLHHKGELRHRLVLAGEPGWTVAPIHETVARLNLGDVVQFLGFVPLSALVALYHLAEFFVFPSLYEGFGLPVIEAMACGAPVLTSNSSSLAEIGADAAHLVEPENIESIVLALRQMAGDSAYRDELSRRGRARAQQFSWQKAAETTRAVYTQVAKKPLVAIS